MFRFTIRDMLWLTVIVALLLGWWLERARSQGQARRIERLEGEVQQVGEAILQKRLEDMERVEGPTPLEQLQQAGYLPTHAIPRIHPQPKAQAKAGE